MTSNPLKYEPLELDFLKHPFGFLKMKVNVSFKTTIEEEVKDKEEDLNLVTTSNANLNVISNAKTEENTNVNNSISNDATNQQLTQANEEIFLLNERIRILNSKVDEMETDKMESQGVIKNLENSISALKNQASSNLAKDPSVKKRVILQVFNTNYFKKLF